MEDKQQSKSNGKGKTNLISQQRRMIEKLRNWIYAWLEANIEFKGNLEPEEKNQYFHTLGLQGKAAGSFLKDLQEYLGYSLREDILDEYSDIESFCWRIVRNEPVAIVGMRCRFPGAESIEEFWNMLKNGESGIGDASERWDMSIFYNPDPDCPGTVCGKWAGFIKNIEDFDAHFFRMSPKLSSSLSLTTRLALLDRACRSYRVWNSGPTRV